MPSPPFSHLRLFRQADGWFDRARAALLGVIPCRRGCHHCCIGPFAITALDMAALQQGMVSLASSIRHDIQEQARRQVAAMETAFPRLKGSPSLGDWSDAEVDLVVERFADFPCPALDSEGSCRVYPFRPATCRTMGIPVDENGRVQGACEIQTAVPIVRLPRALREEEDKIAALEAAEIRAEGNSRDRIPVPNAADEVLLAYGFLPE